MIHDAHSTYILVSLANHAIDRNIVFLSSSSAAVSDSRVALLFFGGAVLM